MDKTPTLCDKTEVSEFENEVVATSKGELSTAATKLIPSETQNEPTLTTVERFCQEFLREFYSVKNVEICVKELTERFNVKSRRVYDLLGILDGLASVEKMRTKGRYRWLGVKSNEYRYSFEKGKAVALKDVAGILKFLIFKNRQGLSIRELNELVSKRVEEATSREQNRATINRRIYECLKIMRILGLVHKSETGAFRYNFGQNYAPDCVLSKQNAVEINRLASRE